MAFKWIVFFLIILIAMISANLQNNKDQTLPKSTSDRTNEDTCVENQPFVWCIPKRYNNGKAPWRYRHLMNASFPWTYQYNFAILDVKNVNDKKQTVSMSMYLDIAWLEPRLKINSSAADWNDTRFGSHDEVDVPPGVLKHLWNPDLEIHGMEEFVSKDILKEMATIRINKTGFVEYGALVHTTISCKMNFDRYPLDKHQCPFRIGSYASTEETVKCTDEYEFDENRQRSLQYFIEIDSLLERDRTFNWHSKNYSVCGVNISLNRTRMQIFFQVYLTSMLFVVVSWVSFTIKPDTVPGRMGALVITFLALINIFNGVKSNAPVSVSLNAVDLYIVICIGQVFLALLEYAVILFWGTSKVEPTSSLEVTARIGSSTIQNDNVGATTALPEKHPSRNKLDSLSLVIFPIFFIIFNVIYGIIYI